MSWSVISDNLSGSQSLENLPSGYRLDLFFFNAFFKAYKERLGYLYADYTSADFDDIIFTDPSDQELDSSYQVHSRELQRRLTIFHDIVQEFISSTSYYQTSTKDEIDNLDEDFLCTRSGDGLGLITLSVWNQAALESLLTEEVYDMIFGAFEIVNARRAEYWSGIYKLLKYVILYPSMQVSTSEAPEEITQPTIFFNDSMSTNITDEGIYSSEDPSVPTTTTKDPQTMFNDAKALANAGTVNPWGLGGNRLQEYNVTHVTTNNVPPNNNVYNILSSEVQCAQNIYVNSPFFKSPTKMNLRMIGYSSYDRSFESASDVYRLTIDNWGYKEVNPVYEDISTSEIADKSLVPSTKTFDGTTTTYTPDIATFISARGFKRDDFVGFDEGINELSIDFFPDLLNEAANFIPIKTFTYQGGFHTTTSGAYTGEFKIFQSRYTVIMGELPQGSFEYPV